MQQYLVTIEFRFTGVRKFELDSKSITKTIGVFGSLEDAHSEANKVLEGLEKQFPLNPNYNRKERFGQGSFNFNLISDLGYLKTPFYFCVKITTLNYLEDINDEVMQILDDMNKAKKLKESYED